MPLWISLTDTLLTPSYFSSLHICWWESGFGYHPYCFLRRYKWRMWVIAATNPTRYHTISFSYCQLVRLQSYVTAVPTFVWFKTHIRRSPRATNFWSCRIAIILFYFLSIIKHISLNFGWAFENISDLQTGGSKCLCIFLCFIMTIIFNIFHNICSVPGIYKRLLLMKIIFRVTFKTVVISSLLITVIFQGVCLVNLVLLPLSWPYPLLYFHLHRNSERPPETNIRPQS